ncbi:MAG TPA: hypothetical protein VMA37_13465 [Acetobacteraceae bacterium]|nr:hypothetical protein [Acetobacteraceae bacterium]
MAILIRQGEFQADYDSRGDVLYVSRGNPRASESERHDRGVLLRYAFDNGAASGVTIIGYHKNGWGGDLSELAQIVVNHLGGNRDDALAIMSAATESPNAY